jgi:hypothetical protein
MSDIVVELLENDDHHKKMFQKYVHIFEYTNIWIDTNNTFKYICTHMHMYACTYIHINGCNLHICMCISICIHISLSKYTNTCISI